MRPRPVAAFTVAFAVVGTRAEATGEVGRAVQDPNKYNTRVGVEQEVSGFDLPIARGVRHTLAPRGDWSPADGLSLRARFTYHQLWLSGGEHRAGPGDSELRLKARVYSSGGNRMVQTGVIQTMPTGDASRGLGNGALVVTPFVTAGYKIDRAIFFAYVSDSVTLRNTKARVYDDLTDPSTNHETRNAVGVIAGPFGALQGNATLNATTILTGIDLGRTFAWAAAILAFAPVESFRVQAGGQLPIAGDRRFDYKVTLDAYFFL